MAVKTERGREGERERESGGSGKLAPELEAVLGYKSARLQEMM